MDLRHLTYFLAVVEEGNISRAAQRLHLSQPPLTRAIHELEDHLGASLFIRTPRGVELTEAGRMLAGDARNILALVEQSTDRARRAGRGELGKLEIGVFGSSILNIVPRILVHFSEARPDVEIALHHDSKQQNLDAVRQGKLHVMFDRGIPRDDGIVVEEIAREPMLVALHARSPLTDRAEIRLELLKDFPIIAGTGLLDPIWGEAQHMGFQPQVAQRVADVVTALALVAQGLGWALVPASASAVALPGLVYRRIEGRSPSVPLECGYRPGSPSPTLAALLGVARRFAPVIARETLGDTGGAPGLDPAARTVA